MHEHSRVAGEGEVARGGDSVMGHWMGNYDGSNFYHKLTRILTPKIVQVLETGNIEFKIINDTIFDAIL